MAEPNITNLLSLDTRWPKAGDRLFVQSKPAFDAHLAQHAGARLYHLTGGYKIAADLLVAQTETEAWKRRKLVYPVLFCYRHFLELTLKTILDEYGSMGNVPPVWTHHRLEDLWIDFRLLLHNINGDNLQEDGTDAVEECIAEFAKIDPSSATFRYPVGRNGQPFENNLDYVDLFNLRATMQTIENYFIGAEGFLGHLQETGRT